jgi:hypothetical protein
LKLASAGVLDLLLGYRGGRKSAGHKKKTECSAKHDRNGFTHGRLLVMNDSGAVLSPAAQWSGYALKDWMRVLQSEDANFAQCAGLRRQAAGCGLVDCRPGV